MIILRFDGGLGNQMYHYVMYKLLKKTFPEHQVVIDITSYNRQLTHNGYELEYVFPQINIQKAKVKDLLCCSYYFPVSKNSLLSVGCDKIYSKLKQSGLIKPPKHYIRESNWNVFKEKANLSRSETYYLDCRWDYQENYYFEWKDELLRDFDFGQPISEEEIQDILYKHETVGIHVRAGDYLNSDFDILTQQYYRDAIDKMQQYVQNPYFVIVSDDYNYAKEILGFMNDDKLYFIPSHQGRDSFQDMQILSKCKHNIIANSTFSYWAAELNSNEEKIVIAPKRYSKKQENFIVPSDWIQLDIQHR